MKVTWWCPAICDPMDSPWDSPGQNTGVGSLSLLQGIFPTQGLNSGLPHCRRDSLPAEPQEKPKNTGVGSLSLLQRILLTRNQTRVSYIASGFFTNWAIREALVCFNKQTKKKKKRGKINFCITYSLSRKHTQSLFEQGEREEYNLKTLVKDLSRF